MNIFGLEITRRKAVTDLQSIHSSHRWWNSFWGPILEADTGNWQRNVTLDNNNTLLANSAVYACVTGIASDIAKMRIKLCRDVQGIWEEITQSHGNAADSFVISVLRKPNHYQTRLKFVEQWIVSKLLHGNTYVLKERNRDGQVVAMYVLDPLRVVVLIAEDGSIYYELKRDDLSQVKEGRLERIIVPASEIIHDMMVSLWHPLIGVSPLYACALTATMGNRIQQNSTLFFQNLSRPGGMLTAPGAISNDTATRLKTAFEAAFSGSNMGRLFVAGDGLEFKGFTMPAEQAQLIEQLRFTVEDVARAFRYPLWKLGGPMPPYTKPDQAQTMYYADCLHPYVVSLEELLDRGLSLPTDQGTEMDVETLLRMDLGSLYETIGKGARFLTPDEQRFMANKPKIKGGDTIYLQEQDHSLDALAERDDGPDPFGTAPKQLSEAPQPVTENEDDDIEERSFVMYKADFQKELALQ